MKMKGLSCPKGRVGSTPSFRTKLLPDSCHANLAECTCSSTPDARSADSWIHGRVVNALVVCCHDRLAPAAFARRIDCEASL